ncbi:MAG: N-acetylneuraminate synthase family protein [Nitrosopumilaceae archaeon]
MFKIGKHLVGERQPIFIIAEPGINHFGKIGIAKKLIKTAAKCGADAIKFQTIFPEEVYSEKVNPELFHKLQKSCFTKKQWIELKKYAKNNEIEFFCTPAGEKSAKLLKEIGVPCFKIGSGELNKKQLIDYVAEVKFPVLISTGMTTIQEITNLVKKFKISKCPFALLHCNSSYPTPYEDANLSTILLLKKKFHIPIGYSDHTIGTTSCLAAAALGACIIEKHFILDKSAWAIEDKLSSNPKELTSLIKNVRLIEKSIGKPRKGLTNSEKKSKETMRYSIAAVKNIPAGTKITKSLLTILRPGTGIQPKFIDNLIGLTTKQSIKEGTLVGWDKLKD